MIGIRRLDGDSLRTDGLGGIELGIYDIGEE